MCLSAAPGVYPSGVASEHSEHHPVFPVPQTSAGDEKHGSLGRAPDSRYPRGDLNFPPEMDMFTLDLEQGAGFPSCLPLA